MSAPVTTASGILYTDPMISAPPISLVKVHPLVIFQMVESYERRVSEEHAMGIVLGTFHEQHAYVLDSFPCLSLRPGTIEGDLRDKLLDEHRRLYPNELLLGYYSCSQQRIDWPDLLTDDKVAIHIWMRPVVPPKLDVLIIKLSRGIVISSPVEYEIEASPAEQLGLSRLADRSSQGSLQAAVNELVGLLTQIKQFCQIKQSSFARDKLVGRAIYCALQRANLSAESREVLEKAKQDMEAFLQQLRSADGNVARAEEELSLPFD
jgi:hypothetical protein